MKSGIYLVNQTTQTLPSGSAIDLGGVAHKYGCNCNYASNSVNIFGNGYFKLVATVTGYSTALGTIKVTAYQDGEQIEGASATATVAAGVITTLPIVTRIYQTGCRCDNASRITLVWSGDAGTVTNVSFDIEKS